MNNRLFPSSIVCILAAIFTFSNPRTSWAASGTWNVDASGNWSNSANWSGGVVADGINGIANFSTVDVVSSAKTVTVDSVRTIGHLLLGDAASPWLAWNLNGTDTLTLAVWTGTPTITCTNVQQNVGVVLAGNQGLKKDGPSTLRLNGANVYTGDTTISAGALKIGVSNCIPHGAGKGNVLVQSGATLDNNGFSTAVINGLSGAGTLTDSSGTGTKTLTVGDNDQTSYFNGVIRDGSSAVLALTKIGTGTLKLDGPCTNTGAITISAGAVAIGTGGTNGSVLGNIINNAALFFNRSDNPAPYAGVISGSGNVTKQGGGILRLNGVNTYAGDTTIAGGTLKYGSAGCLPNGTGKGNLIINAGGKLDVNGGFNASINGLSGAGLVLNTGGNGTSTLTVGNNDASTAFSGSISNAMSGTTIQALTKAGSGTLTLNGANSYTGATTVSAGTLVVNGSLAAGSAVAVSYGATLGGTGINNGPVTVNSGGTLSPGVGIGTLTFGNTLTLSGTTSMQINKTAGTADKIVMSSGTVTLGGTLNVTNLAGTLANGDSFDLMDGSIAGSFTTLNLPTPPLGLQWNTSQLVVNGNISVEYAPLAISGQPTNATLHAGATATLNVSAIGFNLSYQWRRNGVNIPGATNATLTLTTVQFTNAGLYDVVISNPQGLAASDLIRLTVWTPGGVVAWGWNTTGQTDVPPGLTNAVGIAGGYAHTLALLDGGTILGWGNNSDGQTNTPAGLSSVVAIGAGDYHNLALKADGTVVAWGWNANGQTDVPADLTNAVAIAAGYNYSLALKKDHRIVAWGVNDFGQTNVPADLTDGVGIAADDNHSLALRGGGTVALWGPDWRTNVPPGLSNNVVVAGGNTYDAVVGINGGVFAWGGEDYGLTNVPPSATNVVTLAGATWHALALKNDGSVLAWGKNDYGQTNVPAWLGGVRVVAAGQNHSLALCEIDSDGDGVADNWERFYFGDLSQDGSGDADGDGLSDAYEVLVLQTNPLVPNSPPPLSQIAIPQCPLP
jgi:autotransporter-associated beta strand protein